MGKKIKTLLFLSILLLSIFTNATVKANIEGDELDTVNDSDPNKTVSIKNPIDTKSPQELIGKVIKAVLGISGSLALLMFIYGGFTWMLSGGSAEKVTKGKNTLIWASIGLIVIFSSYAMVMTIFKGLDGI